MNKLFIPLISILIMVLSGKMYGQATTKTDAAAKKSHSWVMYVGGGFSSYIAPVNLRPVALAGSINRSSVSGTARLMWYPNHLLRFGVESGFTNFYSYNVKNGNTSGRVSLTAIPVLFVWSMEVVKRINVYAGVGTYILNTKLDYEQETKSRDFVLGSNIAVSYSLPLNKRLGIAAEAKWMNAFETKDAALSMQVQMVWKFVQL